MRETRAMHQIAIQRSNVIELTSTALQKFVKTVQKLLRHGVGYLAPGITRLEVVKDPGSIDDITGVYCWSLTQMDEQTRTFGRSIIYKMCQYLDNIYIHLEKSYEAIRKWNENEQEEYNEWRSIDVDSLDSRHKLIDAHYLLLNIVDDQLKLLVSLKSEFTSMTNADMKLMDLFAQCAGSQLAVQLMAQKQLERDDATMEVGKSLLLEAMHPELNFHRSTHIAFIKHFASVAALGSCEVLMDFRSEIQEEKGKIENVVGVEQRRSRF